MKLTEQFLNELDREAQRTRRALENVPEGRDDWKPHDKSMPLGRLAGLVAMMPSWLAMIVSQNELDLNPPGGSSGQWSRQLRTNTELLEELDKGTAAARAALKGTTDDHLMKPWRLLVATKVVQEDPRYVVLRESINHLAHHRGQLTVYLRMNGAKVPAIYGPSADDPRFV
jgi:uncharacterized damage-inducible protein DinB